MNFLFFAAVSLVHLIEITRRLCSKRKINLQFQAFCALLAFCKLIWFDGLFMLIKWTKKHKNLEIYSNANDYMRIWWFQWRLSCRHIHSFVVDSNVIKNRVLKMKKFSHIERDTTAPILPIYTLKIKIAWHFVCHRCLMCDFFPSSSSNVCRYVCMRVCVCK